MKKRNKKNMEDIFLDTAIYIVLIALVLVTLYPVWYVVVASFSTSTSIAKHSGLLLWPEEFSVGAYEMVFTNRLIMGGLKNAVIVLLGSLPLNILLTLLCGYFMACGGLFWKKPINFMIMFTMFFNGGLIPNYLNVKGLGLGDSLWALILPGALSVYNAIICKTAIEAIPESLKESAYIDGAQDFQILFKIITPLIKPTLAVLTLYYGVAHWNSWFPASIYITKDELLPVQNIIRSILLANDTTLTGTGDLADNYNYYAETIKYAAIVITTAPILCVYPFLQKYFTKGVMIGAVKG
ncbi:MAG: carbohydrate ABC transporter permease [Lachnospiraceae bacterium]|nr:carbohydrate ABC transporter permease [Lachnospiraceae bacterium]